MIIEMIKETCMIVDVEEDQLSNTQVLLDIVVRPSRVPIDPRYDVFKPGKELDSATKVEDRLRSSKLIASWSPVVVHEVVPLVLGSNPDLARGPLGALRPPGRDTKGDALLLLALTHCKVGCSSYTQP
jgi:hypothetical protein